MKFIIVILYGSVVNFMWNLCDYLDFFNLNFCEIFGNFVNEVQFKNYRVDFNKLLILQILRFLWMCIEVIELLVCKGFKY